MDHLDWISLGSSCLSRVAYVEGEEHLYVEFAGGIMGCYKNVPVFVFNNLILAPSHGKYFSAYIRNSYPFEYI